MSLLVYVRVIVSCIAGRTSRRWREDLLDLFHYADHFHGCPGCICTGVAHFRTGSFDGLFECVAGQNAEDGRRGRIVVDLSDSPYDLLANGVIVACLASDDGAETEHGDVFAAEGDFFGGHCDFTGARDPYCGDLVFIGAVARETIDRSGEQLRGDKLVESAHYDGVLAFSGIYLAFYLLHHSRFFLKTKDLPVSYPAQYRNPRRGGESSAKRLGVMLHYKTVEIRFPQKPPIIRASGRQMIRSAAITYLIIRVYARRIQWKFMAVKKRSGAKKRLSRASLVGDKDV